MSYGTGELECGFFETLNPTTSTGITAALLSPVPISGKAQAGNAAYLTLAASESAVDGDTKYTGRRVTITSGAGIGQTVLTTGYAGSTKRAAGVFGTAPDSTSSYVIKSAYDGLAAKEALIVAEAQSIRFRLDGVAPTATVGMVLAAGSSMIIGGTQDLKNFRCIDTSAGASTVQVQVYF
jgi:hypothetical protein